MFQKLFSRLRRPSKEDGTPYVIGGMAGVLLALIVAVFCLSAVDQYLLRSSSLAAVISSVLVDLTNGDRGAGDLGGLTVNPVLTAAAQAKADDMALKGYFAHVAPDGKDSWYWFKQAGYSFIYAGENLAVNFSDSVDVEHAWMNSPTHRANILNGHFTQIGIATAQGIYQGRQTTFVVQLFGTPAPAQTTPQIQTTSTPPEPTALALATAKPATTSAVAGASVTTQEATATAAMGEVAVLGAEETGTAPVASWWEFLLASPKTALLNSYYLLAAFVLAALAAVTEFELHRRHTHHYVAATLLVACMVGLFIFASLVFFTQPVVAAL